MLGNWGDCPVGFGDDNQCVEGDCTALCECVGRGACCGVEGNPADCGDNRTAAECADVGGSYIPSRFEDGRIVPGEIK